MEPLIRVKDFQLKEIRKMLAPDEQIFVAVNYGRTQVEEGQFVRAFDVDYLLLTDKRLIDIKGRFFKDQTGFCAYPRRLVTVADAKHFHVGSTLTIKFRNDCNQGEEISIAFQNCGKPDAEAIVKELNDQVEMRRCPNCMRRLEEEFTFCPFCRTPLNRICSRCGKPQQADWSSCPFCGCK
jgi:hypothetical protein